MAKTTFSLEYIISIVVTLFVIGILQARAPGVNVVVKIISGLIIAYLSLWVMNMVFPKINDFGNAVKHATVGITQQNIYNSGFAEIYPPLLAVFIIFLVCLYSGKI